MNLGLISVPKSIVSAAVFILFLLVFFWATEAKAATLQTVPGTGVYSINNVFSVRITVNTVGQNINAAEGELRFNPQELSVVSVDRVGSVFNLWVTEPTHSNAAGTITFSGGSPTGYTGTNGTVFNVTFRALRAGNSRLTFNSGAVLANDGRGTNILSGMSGGTFTVQAVSTQPTPEVVQYVAPANTPAAPAVVSETHPAGQWSTLKSATLSWSLPSGVTAVRTSFNQNPTAIPTNVQESLIRTITLNDLPEGESYFHIQFQNAAGWGRVTHYKISVDSQKPESVTISLPETADLMNPVQSLLVTVKDEASPILRYLVRINNDPVIEYTKADLEEGLLVLPALSPGHHTVLIEAFDSAGNSQIGTFSFNLDAFTPPQFTEFPRELNEGVIPVLLGQTRPGASVSVSLTKIGAESNTFNIVADAAGKFVFIPGSPLTQGVYEVTAQAVDGYGAQSLASEPIRIAVQQPGFLRIGSFLVSVLSVVVPLVGMSVLLFILFWWLILSSRRLRRRVSFESQEAEEILRREFTGLQNTLETEVEKLTEMKKTKKLSEYEESVFSNLALELRESEKRIQKEIKDVGKLIK